MVDDSKLDYIRTFLGKVHTAATVKHISEIRNIWKINDTQRMLVHEGEVVGQFATALQEQYKIEIVETNEANLTTAINNVIKGINSLKKQQTIAAYTKPGILAYIKFDSRGKAKEHPKTKLWTQEIYITATWVV